MTELSLRGVDEDESVLVLEDPAGGEHRLPVDDSLIAAVRGAHRRRAASGGPGEPLRPRDIQAMIRQGMTAEEIAEETGTELAHIRVYEGPVLAEREHIAHQARRVLIRPETDAASPTPLAELALERLRLREVDPETMAWDAWRRADGAWQVELRFEAGARLRTAGWSYSRGSVHALDDEARWLSDAGPTDSGPIPGYGSGEERRQRAAEAVPAPALRDHQTETGRILESLRRRRGVTSSQHTSEIPLGSGEPGTDGPSGDRTESSLPAAGGLRLVGDDRDQSIDGAHSAPSAPAEARDAGIVAVPAPEGGPERTPAERHPDQHTEPIGTPDFDDPEFAGTLPPAPAPGPAVNGAPEDEGAEDPGPGADHPVLLRGLGPEADGAGEADGTDAGAPLPDPSPAEEPAPDDGSAQRPADGGGRRKGRSSVPSWDEIMFGGRRKD
ncbi:septation protein SepH [Brevibacterium album]|uniref:septation protein SepH n=1 Tax=Brevibacterium album TaxID=417948 RepID=UPI000405391A|nr:septation protein SepH [Brevibacterium album]